MASTIIMTTGVPGSGKTFVRCARFLVDDFLIHSNGVHYSNFPVNVDAVVASVVRRSNLCQKGIWAKLTAPFRVRKHIVTDMEIRKRIQVIPDDVLQSWRNEESGPWDYFQGIDLKYAHIAIDEIHNFVSDTGKSVAYIRKWDDFLGEVRHRGCTFEGLTQNFKKVHECLVGRAGLRYELVPAEDLRDPFFGVQMMDWYNLKAGFTGCFHKTVFEREYQLRFGRWSCLKTRRFLISPDYFQYYNSFNASLQEKETGASDKNRVPEYEYQRRTKLSLFFWFCFKNSFHLVSRFLLVVFVFWLTLGGGITYCISHFLNLSKKITEANGHVQESKKTGVESSKDVSSAHTGKNFLFYGKNLSDFTKDEKINFTLEEVKAIQSDINLSHREILKLSSDLKFKILENKKLNSSLMSDYKPVFFAENKVILKNGVRIYENYVFREGDFKGKKVVFINLANRSYRLCDGTIIRM